MDTEDREPKVVSRTATDESLAFSYDDSEPAAFDLRIGRYVVVESLGQGAFGVVYRAHDEELARDVAIKLLRGHLHIADESQLRFRREARALAKLSHPNVIQVYEVGDHGGQIFIVMELVEGVTLRNWLKAGGHSVDEVVSVFTQIGRGLAAAHAADLVHRDFKPDNVLVGNDGRPRVLDFGLVRSGQTEEDPIALREPDPGNPLALSLTEAGSLMGTPAYMSPEQHRGEEVDARSDQFSFAVALFEALYGVRPFSGRSIKELRQQCTQGRVVDLPAHSVPAWIHAIVMRALSPRAEDRFESMDALLEALGRDPAAKRRRGLVTATLVASLALGVWGLVRPTSQSDPCPRDPSLGGVWVPDRARAIENSFEASGVGFAKESWAQTQARLETMTNRLADAQVESCEAATTDPLGLTPQLDCEAEAVRALDRALQRLEHADEDPSVIFRTTSILGRVIDPESCRDPERAKALAATLPDHPELARIAEDILQVAADPMAPTAIELARDALLRAQENDAPRLAVQASRNLARALISDARDDEARSVLEQSVWESVALEDPAEAATTAILYAGVLAGAERDQADFRATVRLARALTKRAGSPKILRIALLHVEGDRSRLALDRPGQLAAFDAALALEPEDVDTELLLRQGRVDALVALGRNAEAETAARENFERVQPLLGRGHPTTLTYQEQLGLALANNGKLPEAFELYAEALETAKNSVGPHDDRYLLILHNLATTLGEAGEDERARERFLELLPLAEAAGPEQRMRLATALNGLAVVESRLALHQEAMVHVVRALGLMREQLGVTHPMVGVLEMTQAEVHLAADQPQRALDTYAEALTKIDGRIDPNDPLFGHFHHGRGTAYLRLGKKQSAREALERALEIRRQSSQPPAALAQTRAELARAWFDDDSRRARTEAGAALADFARSRDRRGEAQFREWTQAHFPDLVSEAP